MQARLREAELALASLSSTIRETQSSIESSRQNEKALRAERTTANESAKDQETAIAQELRATYIAGGGDELRLLLGEDDPQKVARLMAYYRYILGARSDLIDSYREKIASLIKTEHALQEQEQKLALELASLERQQQSLTQASAERRELLASVNARIANDAAELAAREADQAELESLLVEIEAALAQLFPEQTVESFSSVKGAMAWPVKGRLTHRFGRPRNQGKMRWQGVRLKADAGTPVAAIHHGRVVYADWLRGSGLLLVIDHGEGYMSLYAHNETLLRDVGDWVSAGAPVSTVGDSGGQSEVGLYFEIRKDGKPTDPQSWCRG